MTPFLTGFTDELVKTGGVYFRPTVKSLLATALIGGGLLSLRGRKKREDKKRLIPDPKPKLISQRIRSS